MRHYESNEVVVTGSPNAMGRGFRGAFHFGTTAIRLAFRSGTIQKSCCDGMSVGGEICWGGENRDDCGGARQMTAERSAEEPLIRREGFVG